MPAVALTAKPGGMNVSKDRVKTWCKIVGGVSICKNRDTDTGQDITVGEDGIDIIPAMRSELFHIRSISWEEYEVIAEAVQIYRTKVEPNMRKI